ncbi:hypothetical protein F4861DRAFT_515278 [Xylaria intraflava]|nr:hypothetical protein F4861DRAFT_515278 [Xylaria intraflava]
MGPDHDIDGLLERYLHLLHEYTSLREELTALQTGIYQNIARANFAAERGVRFGQDYYDDRMQASRLLAIICHSGDQAQNRQDDGLSKGHIAHIIPTFAVTNPASASVSAPTTGGPAADTQVSDVHSPPDEAEAKLTEATAGSSSQPGTNAQSRKNAAAKKGTDAAQTPKDPLRWFGLLTPTSLRQAQAQSVRAVEHVIPRLASVNAEMAGVEIEVRRARKRRAKAEAAASKLTQQSERKQEDAVEA